MTKLKLLKLNMLILASAIFLITSCKKDEDSGGNNNELVGKWTVTSSSFQITIDGLDFVDYLIEMLGLTEEQAQDIASGFESEDLSGTIEFKSDGTYEAVSDSGTETGTWELNGNTLTMDKGTIDETNLTVSTLTSSKLVIEYNESDNSTDWDLDGTNDTMTMEMRVEASK
jgi:hypothetical protein